MSTLFKRVAGLGMGALSFAYLIFVLNPIQTLTVLVRPFSSRGARAINRWCARSIWGWWVVHAELQQGIELRFTGDRPRAGENVLVLPNHQTMADVMLLICLAWRCGRLGDTKFFVKDVARFLPGPGWGMWFLDFIFVERNWAQDEAEILRLFDKFKRDDIPLFLVSFLEGTRRTAAKATDARRYAEERGLVVPERTLVPRTKGFVATVQGLRSHLDAVYDLTIAYETHPAPSLTNCFEGRVRRVDIEVRRHPIAELPVEAEALAAWARARFVEKDEALAFHAEHGHFAGEPWRSDVRLRDWFGGQGAQSASLADPVVPAARAPG